MAKAGLDVLIVEGERFPRDKACGGIATRGIFDLVGPSLDEVIDQYCERTKFFLNMRPVVEYDDPDLLFRRSRFDQLLVDLATEEGAGLKDGVRVIGVDNSAKDHVDIELDGGEMLKARAVVGADGCYSTVSRSVGLFRPLHSCRGNFAVYLEKDLPRKQVDAILGPPDDLRRHSYFFVGMTGMGWAFRKARGINVGIGIYCMSRSDIRERAERFLDDLGLGEFKDELHGQHIPGEFLPRVTADGVLLVGDAAGASNPSTGCGIEDAMKTGVLAAKCLVNLHERGRPYTAGNLRAYESSLATMRRLQSSKLVLLSVVTRLQQRGLGTYHWMSVFLRTIVRLDLERFIWSDPTRF
jgi:flavin-dependent dehydrogenase